MERTCPAVREVAFDERRVQQSPRWYPTYRATWVPACAADNPDAWACSLLQWPTS